MTLRITLLQMNVKASPNEDDSDRLLAAAAIVGAFVTFRSGRQDWI